MLAWKTAMQIEIPDELMAAVAEVAEKTGQDVQSLVTEMLTEAVKLRKVPTVHFEDGATGRRACVPGTGIPIWEIAEFYEYVDRDFQQLKRGFDWISDHHLRAALAYYEAFPDDITPRIKTDEVALAALHALWEKFPQTSPHWHGRRNQAVRSNGGAARESA